MPMKKEALRVSTTIPAAPTTVYLAWLTAEQHSAMTGGTAKIDQTVGGKFTAWDGYISGKLVALDLGRRIIMSWRTTDFPRDAHDSRVEIHFEALGGSTRITILHTEIPEGQGESCRTTWNDKYFAPMRAYFSKYLPDPRKPPPVRRPPPPPEDTEEEEEETPVPPKSKAKPAPQAPPPPPPPKKVVAKPAPPPSKPATKPPPKPAKPEPKAAAAKPTAKKPSAPPPKKAPVKPAPVKPAKKAAAKPVKKPATKPARKPAAKPAKKPAAKPAKKKKK